jgi:hypothetical protein
MHIGIIAVGLEVGYGGKRKAIGNCIKHDEENVSPYFGDLHG